MARKRANGAGFGFSNEKFLELLSSSVGISPSGVLGRETPLDLSTLESARGSLLIRELFSKYDDGKSSSEKEAVTWKRFQEAEDLCRDTNFWVPRTFKHDPFWRGVAMRVQSTLGVLSWDECAKFFGFGPGSTTRLPRRRSQAAYKYSGKPESTLGNATLASCAISMNPMWKHIVRSSGEGPDDGLVTIVRGNSVITVPKNYKTDRTIAKEPDMNIYVQKGLGAVIRRRLKRVGVDLDDQRRNQEGARLGSLTGQLATIDLSMASDTVSTELVSFLLPNDWWWALEQSRSPVGVLPDGSHLVYQKLSSMGNGFTFELESLLFWSVCQQVACPNINDTDSRILVYGDDIVVPTDQAETVLFRLWQAGFKPNLSKTFYAGPYRESCGKHYFQGCDITPFYIRKPVRSLEKLFLVHNNVYRWCERTGVSLQEVLTKLRELAPARWRRPRLPDGFGDGAFIGAVDELRLDSHPFGWECWVTKALAVSQQLIADDLPEGQMVASLMQLSSVVNSPFERELGIEEHPAGLPVMEGRHVEIDLCVPRFSPA